jgi:DNA-directed RNA polymerase specialized sigma24 family protein
MEYRNTESLNDKDEVFVFEENFEDKVINQMMLDEIKNNKNIIEDELDLQIFEYKLEGLSLSNIAQKLSITKRKTQIRYEKIFKQIFHNIGVN